ncbi:toprim domain-containing protein [Treponema sp. R6D11]
MNLIELLQKYNIPYKERGKNITRGWVNISCPHCGDNSTHGGISPTLGYNCWRCGKNSLARTLSLLKVSYNDINALYSSLPRKHKAEIINHKKFIELPGEEKPSKVHIKYLEKRQLDVTDLITLYKIRFTRICKFKGKEYRNCIVIPVTDAEGVVSSFLCRAIGSTARYLNADQEFATPIKELLYNYQVAKNYEAVVLFEGVFDLWDLGIPDAVCGFGVQLSKAQMLLLSNFKRVVIYFDNDEAGQKNAKKLAKNLMVLGVEVIIFTHTFTKYKDFNSLPSLTIKQKVAQGLLSTLRNRPK